MVVAGCSRCDTLQRLGGQCVLAPSRGSFADMPRNPGLTYTRRTRESSICFASVIAPTTGTSDAGNRDGVAGNAVQGGHIAGVVGVGHVEASRARVACGTLSVSCDEFYGVTGSE